MKKVFIVGGDWGSYTNLFKSHGFGVVEHPDEADLLVFTGGEDVSPSYYGEARHVFTHSNPLRDEFEKSVFQNFLGTPMVGICRGGQFLNVMCGGKLYQHVNNHTREHPIYHPDGGEAICMATSTHHQMMIPGEGGEVLAIANESTNREHCGPTKGRNPVIFHNTGMHDDTEVVYYEVEKCLCFQPHPEMGSATPELKSYFFQLLKDKLEVFNE